MTEEEYQKTLELARRYAATEVAMEATQIVGSLFAGPESLGTLRLREHQLFSPEMNITRFLAVLNEVFSSRGP